MVRESVAATPATAAKTPKQAGRVQSLKAGASSQILPLIVSYGLNLLATPFIVRQLGLHDFGIWAMTGAMAQYASLLDLGASRAANRYVALFHARGETDKDRAVVGICLTFVVGLGAALYAVAFLGAGIAEKVLHTDDLALTRFLLLCSVTVLACGLVARVLASASFGRGRQLPPNIGLALLGAAQLISGVVALTLDPTLHNFARGTAVGAVIGLCALVLVIVIDEGRITIGRPRAGLAREIIVFGVHSQVAGAADIVLYQSGKLIAGVVIGPAAAGAYELGIRLVQGVQAFAGAAAVAINTHLTRAYATAGMGEIREQYARLTQRNAAVAIFLPFLLGVTAQSAVPLWLGAHQNAVITVVSALSFSIAVNVSTAVCSSTMYAVGRPGLMGAEGAVYASVSVVLAVVLATTLGFNGMVGAYAGWIALGNLLGVWFLQSRVGLPMKEFLTAIAGPFGVATVAAVVAMPINLFADPGARADAVVPFLTSAAVFSAIYLTLAWRFGYLPRISRNAIHHPLQETEDADGKL
jgi:O-antigen/teichoic acid export membrane protein